jgi:hypothetical protein
MREREAAVQYRTLTFRVRVHAPLEFVYRWCTDFRADDDRLTNSIYQYRADIVLREPRRIVRVIRVPGKDRNRSTDVEIISLQPPNQWSLKKFSVTDDKTGHYRLRHTAPTLTLLEMKFREKWKVRNPPDRTRYRELFVRVWNRYRAIMEEQYHRSLRVSRPGSGGHVREETGG